MPGFILHVGATVMCSHAGSVQPTAPNPRVLVSGQPVVTMAAPYVVAGCPFNVSGGPSPCITAQWVTAATRVLANGQPLVLVDSQAVCTPNGTPLIVTATQTRAVAT
jgi:uncharacterized Zn-binding protein involved in type VI secretion